MAFMMQDALEGKWRRFWANFPKVVDGKTLVRGREWQRMVEATRPTQGHRPRAGGRAAASRPAGRCA